MNYNDPARLNELVAQSCLVIDEIMVELGVTCRRNIKRIYGTCPVHGGDNPMAFNMYPDGDQIGGIWVCHTHHCEKKWKKTLIGFVHAMLSRDSEEKVTWIDAVNWLCKFLGYKSLADINKPTMNELSRRQYAMTHKRTKLIPKQITGSWTQQDIRKKIDLPSEYYKKRGYDPKLLDKYDVGWYNIISRVLIPIYDDNHRFAVGFTARAVYPKCEKCQQYHNSNGCQIFPKWKHSRGFEANKYLYNYWFAKDHIRNNMTIILVEGPGDVWKLEQNGIHNSVALFGVELSDEQKFIIEQSGAMSCVVMMDNDTAGQRASLEIKSQLGRFLRLYFPIFDGDDVGDLHIDIVTGSIKPLIDKIRDIYK